MLNTFFFSKIAAFIDFLIEHYEVFNIVVYIFFWTFYFVLGYS